MKLHSRNELFKPVSRIFDLREVAKSNTSILTIAIPENITQKIGLEIGDSFEWLTYDPKNNIVRLKLWKNENKETY